MLALEKIIATKTNAHREPPIFARKGQNEVAQARAPGAEAISLSWSSAGSPKEVPRRSAWLPLHFERGPMKLSANGLSLLLITRGVESSMHVKANFQGLLEHQKKGQRRHRGLRWLLAGATLVNTEREASKFATCGRSAERTGLAVEAWVGSSAELRGNRQSSGPTSLASCLGRTRTAVLSRGERRSEVKRLLHEVQG